MIRKLIKDERGQWEIILILLLVVIVLVVVVLAVLLGATLILTPIALFIYIWQRIFPFARGIAEWTADRINLITFFLFMNLFIIPTGTLLIIWIILYWQTGSIVFILLALPMVLLLGLELFIFGVPMGLAIILITIRLNHHMYQRFKTRFLTFAFKMVMRRAMRHQAIAPDLQPPAEKPKKKAKKRRWRIKRRQSRPQNQQQKPETPEPRGEKPQSRAKKRRWRAKRRQ